MAAVILLTTVPTDRALTGWCVFGVGQGVDWERYFAQPGQRILDLVSGYVWA
jgi:hypothetical protein